MAASALEDATVEILLAKVSGRDVPNATNVIPVMAFFNPTTHPNSSASSPTIAHMTPIPHNEKTKHNQPPQYSVVSEV
jgi:hypothetical protein